MTAVVSTIWLIMVDALLRIHRCLAMPVSFFQKWNSRTSQNWAAM